MGKYELVFDVWLAFCGPQILNMSHGYMTFAKSLLLSRNRPLPVRIRTYGCMKLLPFIPLFNSELFTVLKIRSF